MATMIKDAHKHTPHMDALLECWNHPHLESNQLDAISPLDSSSLYSVSYIAWPCVLSKMSARQPFRPKPTQKTTSVDETAAATNDPFRSVPGLLDQPTKPSEEQTRTARPSTSSGIENGTNKPLNIAGFAKRKSDAGTTAAALPSNKARRTSHDASVHASSTTANNNNNNVQRSPAPQNPDIARIAARGRPSSPFNFANFPSGFVPTARTPRLSDAHKTHTSSPGNEFSSNQAHIPTSDANLGFAGNPNRDRGSEHRRASSRPSLESINETAEEYNNINTHGASLGIPQFSDGLDGPPSDSLALDVNVSTHQDRMKAAGKRPHHAQAGEDDLDYGVGAKRYRTDIALDEQQVSVEMTYQ